MTVETCWGGKKVEDFKQRCRDQVSAVVNISSCANVLTKTSGFRRNSHRRAPSPRAASSSSRSQLSVCPFHHCDVCLYAFVSAVTCSHTAAESMLTSKRLNRKLNSYYFSIRVLSSGLLLRFKIKETLKKAC